LEWEWLAEQVRAKREPAFSFLKTKNPLVAQSVICRRLSFLTMQETNGILTTKSGLIP
jgi:hypothetical protein